MISRPSFFVVAGCEMGAPRGIELGVLVRKINGFQGQFCGVREMFGLGYCFEPDQYRKRESQIPKQMIWDIFGDP